jgi:hypothetical protein
MHENMLPYVAYSEMGSGTIMGVENDVNLFIPLENKLRELLGDPTFVIPASQKGTKYKIVRVGTSELTYHTKDRSQLPEMFYNMEFALSALNAVAKFHSFCTIAFDSLILIFSSLVFSVLFDILLLFLLFFLIIY